MSAEIILFNGLTKLDLDPDVILENLKGKLDGFVILGYEKGADEKCVATEFFSSTYADGGTVLWLMERCKRRLMEVVEE